MSRINKTSILTFLFLIVAMPCVSHAQNSATSAPQTSATDTDDLKTQQQMVAELKFLRAENAGVKAERDALKGEVAILTRMNDVEKERGDWFKDAAVKGLKVDSNNGLILANKDTEIRVCTARNADLEKENAGLRSSRNLRTALGFAGGAAIGVFATHH